MTTVGDLRFRITIQALDGAQDSVGDPAEWADVATVWADVRDIIAKEQFGAAAAQQHATTHMTIRYRGGLVPGMRVRFNGEYYHIHAVMQMTGRKDWLVLMCFKGMRDA